MSKLIAKNIITASFIFTVMSLPSPGMAAVDTSAGTTESAKISFSDLDLSQEQGVATLYERLKNTASKVCGLKDTHITGSRVESTKFKRDFKRCYAKALDGAVQSINLEQLSEMHRNNS